MSYENSFQLISFLTVLLSIDENRRMEARVEIELVKNTLNEFGDLIERSFHNLSVVDSTSIKLGSKTNKLSE